MKPPDGLEEKVVLCVDRVLTEVLGEYAKRAVLSTVEQRGVGLRHAYSDPECFIEALRWVFGSAAKTLESLFVEELSRQFGFTLGECKSLKEAVSKIRSVHTKAT